MILTKSDELDKEDQNTKIEEYRKRCMENLSVVETRIFKVENFMVNECRDDLSMKRNLEKEMQVLTALNHILQPCHKPPFLEL